MSAAKTEQIPLFDDPSIQVEVAPLQNKVRLPQAAAERCVVARWVPVSDDLYRLVGEVHARGVRMCQANLDRLKIEVSEQVMKRLVLAGFVRGGKLTPSLWVFDLDSYRAHCRSCYADPSFWDSDHPEKHFKKYRATLNKDTGETLSAGEMEDTDVL